MICKLFFYSMVLFVLTFGSCYTFKGGTISKDAKTISVQYFPNHSTLIYPSLSQLFTEKLKDKFVSQTRLSVVTGTGDLSFEGEIVDYRTQPIAIQSTEQAAQNRLSITVLVKFKNSKEPQYDFESNFTRFADYDSRKNLASIEQTLVEQINSELVDDIFNKAVVNW